MDGYEKQEFAARTQDGYEIVHDIYSKGSGPVVVIIQELPGIGQETLKLADMFEADGFSVVLPHLFGPLGKTARLSNTVRVMCMRREFSLLKAHKTSPIVDWLRALCQDVRQTHKVKGVAVIGMCLTGNFAISLMADDSVLAGVGSQPSMPIGKPGALHMSGNDVTDVRQNLDSKGAMMALRYEKDKLCSAAKFAKIEATFNDDAERVRLRTMPGKGHSVLTLDFVDEAGHPTREAYDEVRAYFHEALA